MNERKTNAFENVETELGKKTRRRRSWTHEWMKYMNERNIEKKPKE